MQSIVNIYRKQVLQVWKIVFVYRFGSVNYYEFMIDYSYYFLIVDSNAFDTQYCVKEQNNICVNQL